MMFPNISAQKRLERLKPPRGKVRMVLDTDTYNEVDDQFALAYALMSPDQLQVEAVYAAPFHNSRSEGPADGMEKSYQEILRIMEKLHISSEGMVFRGSDQYLKDWDHPVESEAARDLIKRAMSCRDDPLHVVAIGAITNVASAILMEPGIIEKIVVVWLGGHSMHWPHTGEFNMGQDIQASRCILDCGVPLVQIPCAGVADHLITTIPELQYYLDGKSEIGTYLTEIVRNYSGGSPYAWSKVIWDISAVAYLVNPQWVPTNLIHSPILTDGKTWSVDQSRHFIRVAKLINRDAIFGDVFRKLTQAAE